MTAKINAIKVTQPESFAFSPRNLERVEEILARYPAARRQSAVMPLLTLAQQQNKNWLTKAAMDHIAEMLGMAPVRVYEVASFYTMYNLEPVGEHCVQVCTTTPCWLRGSDTILKTCEEALGIKCGETTPDGKFSLREVECLGACVNAPMMQVTSANGNDGYYEDLDERGTIRILQVLAEGSTPRPGPQQGRRSSEPQQDDD